MGCGRSLYQAAEDGQLPRFFEHKNRHGVPGFAMGFNVVCSMILVLLGSPVRIYIISNGGYLLSCSLALLGYFVYRQLRPDVPRPFRLPTWAKWLALAVFIIWTVIYFFGGWNSPKIVGRPPPGPRALPARAAHRRPVRAAVLVAARRTAGPARAGPRPAAAVGAACRLTRIAGPASVGEAPWPRPTPRRASRRRPVAGAAACCSGDVAGTRSRRPRPAVLLASSGAPFSKAAVRRARELAAGQPVAGCRSSRSTARPSGRPTPACCRPAASATSSTPS